MAAKKTTRLVAQYKGFHGAQRILTVADQNAIAGVSSGIGKEDLVWGVNNGKLDITDAHADVIEHIKGDSDFTVREVEVDAESTSADSAS